MDIASKEVQAEVQRVSYQEYDDEQEDVVCNGPDGIEHLADNAAGQHQCHDSGIGKKIAEPSGQFVVGKAEDTGDLSEPFGIFHRTVHQHENADEQYDLACGDGDLRQNQGGTDEDDPEGTFIQDRIQDLSAVLLFPETDRHTDVQLDQAEDHGAYQDVNAVLQR